MNAPSDNHFPKALRILRNEQFREVFRHRCSASDQFLVIYALPNQLKYSRLGVCVSRKYGNAVARNRWKRIVRDCFRRSAAALPMGYDFVVLPKGRQRPRQVEAYESLIAVARRAARRTSKAPTKRPRRREK